jgi:hypothetical protein
MSETETPARAKRRRIVEPVKVGDLKGLVIERYREVLLANTSTIAEKLLAWERVEDLELGPIVQNAPELELLAAFYTKYGYTVETGSSQAGMFLKFKVVKVEVKLEDVLPPTVTPKRGKGKKNDKQETAKK